MSLGQILLAGCQYGKPGPSPEFYRQWNCNPERESGLHKVTHAKLEKQSWNSRLTDQHFFANATPKSFSALFPIPSPCPVPIFSMYKQ